MTDLKQLQQEHLTWSLENFPDNRDPIHPVLGVVEEVGELSHALLKQAQGIRGSHAEHEAAAQDAIGDIVIYLCDVCSRRGWDFDEIVYRTWAQVKQRDWQKNKVTGEA
jgi:NTP pyrophosphatase (non-canonical NTP hydrolase)